MKNGLPSLSTLGGVRNGTPASRFPRHAAHHRHHPIFPHAPRSLTSHSAIRMTLILDRALFLLHRHLLTTSCTLTAIARFHLLLIGPAYRIVSDPLDDGKQRLTDCRVGGVINGIRPVLLDGEREG